MPNPWLKDRARGLAAPIGRGIAAIGLGADAITFLGFLLAVAAGLWLAAGRWPLAFAALALSSLCDLLDGAVARARGGGSPIGATLDSTVDRYSESVVLTGVLIHRLQQGVEVWFVWLWALALTASFLISYVRARAEGLGLRCDVGLLERPERLGLLLLLCLIGPRSAPWVLGLLALGGHVTFIQRIVHVARATRRTKENGAR